MTRQDPVIQKMFGWKRMAGHKAFQRYFKKFSQATNQQSITALFQWFFKQIHFHNYTLDVDSKIFTRYGTQEGATKGYNPNKRGRNSHHPLVAFVAEVRMAVNFGSEAAVVIQRITFFGFIENTFERLEGKTIGLFKADSGFLIKRYWNT